MFVLFGCVSELRVVVNKGVCFVFVCLWGGLVLCNFVLGDCGVSVTEET